MFATLLLALAQHGLQEAIDALGGKGGVVADRILSRMIFLL